MIEVPEIRRPGPAAHLNGGRAGDILKSSVAEIAIERIAARVALIELANVFRRLLMELFLLADALSRGLPHARHVDVLVPVVIEISPAATHSRTDAFHVSFF